MTFKLGLSKFRSDRIFIDFSLQCRLELEDWCMVKGNMYWDRSKSFYASESLLPQTATKPFFLKSHKVTFFTSKYATAAWNLQRIYTASPWHHRLSRLWVRLLVASLSFSLHHCWETGFVSFYQGRSIEIISFYLTIISTPTARGHLRVFSRLDSFQN